MIIVLSTVLTEFVFTRFIIMSTGLVLMGLIRCTNFLICSKVGLWVGLWERHRRISYGNTGGSKQQNSRDGIFSHWGIFIIFNELLHLLKNVFFANYIISLKSYFKVRIIQRRKHNLNKTSTSSSIHDHNCKEHLTAVSYRHPSPSLDCSSEVQIT